MNLTNKSKICSAIACAITLVWSTSSIFAAPVSPETARGEASEFLTTSSSHSIHQSPGSTDKLTLAYTSEKESLTCYYVFNLDNGFVIISGDDRLPAVLGYSDKGAFDYDHIPDNMKWWLSQYDNQISSWLPTAPESTSGRRSATRASDRKPIAPLTKTIWDQGTPFNNLCPLDRTGQRSVTGCVATAMAQILKYHNWPDKPVGTAGGITMNGTTYSWRNMLDDYSGTYSATQANAVATLMRQCGAAVNMQYSSYMSGAYDKDVQTALRDNFKYNAALKMNWKDYTPMTQWIKLIYDELAAGRPVYYSGSSSQGGHAFVCDGYGENDYFHFNWGWGGYQDGYFKLTALNPASGGSGSYEAGYNSGQMVITGIIPDKTGSSTPADYQCVLLSTGGFYYEGENTFVIKNSDVGTDIIYNPLNYTQEVYIGLKIVNTTNPDAKPVYLNSGGSEKIESLYGAGGFTTPALPSLPDGKYKIYAVYSPTPDIDWKEIPIPLGKQNYISLTVTGGKLTFSNDGPDPDSQANLIIGAPQSISKIYSNTTMAFKVPILNVGQGDFVGQIGIDLMDADDTEYGDAASYMEQITVPGKSYIELEAIIDYPIAPARYNVSILDNNGNFYLTNHTVTTVNGTFPKTIKDDDITVSSLSPCFMESEKENPIYFSVTNYSILPIDMNFKFIVLDAATLKQVSVLPTTYSLTVPASYEGRVNVRPTDLKLKPGEYMWYVANDKDEALCDPVPLIINSPIKVNDGLSYIITSEQDKNAILVSPEGDPYEGDVIIPETIDGYTVNAIRNDAFAFSKAQAVSLPGTITSLPAGAFYDASYLKNLTLDQRFILKTADNTFNPRFIGNYWLNVRNALANVYHTADIWKDFNMTRWDINLGGGVEIKSGLAVNPETSLVYIPCFVNYNMAFDISFDAPAGMNVKVESRINDILIESKVINPATTTFRLPRLGLQGIGTLTATSTNEEESGVEDIYEDEKALTIISIDGRIIATGADRDYLNTLRPGIYIINGKKTAITKR